MKEAQSNSTIVRSLRAHGLWAHKIADDPTAYLAVGSRFTTPKPFDIISGYQGKLIAIETKLIKKLPKRDSSPVLTHKMIKPVQHLNLGEVAENSKGLALVFLHVKIPRKLDLYYYFSYTTLISIFNQKGSVSKQDLKTTPHLKVFKRDKKDYIQLEPLLCKFATQFR